MRSIEKKYKLLLIAPTIDPNDVGEAYVGFKWVEGLNKEFDLTVLTLCKKGHESIERKLPGAKVISWNETCFFWRFERFNSMFKPWYIYFYFKCRWWIKNKIKKDGLIFDLAFQITPMAMRYPTPVWKLGIPYVLGPLGGGLSNMPGFANEIKKVPWYIKLRNIDELRLQFDPLLRRNFKDAEMIIGSAPHVIDKISHFINIKKGLVVNELGIDNIFKINRTYEGRIKLLFVGRIIRIKGVRDLVRSMGLLQGKNKIELDVVGEGDDLSACKQEVKRLGIENKVKFHGKLPREKVNYFYERANLFVFPSIREPTGGVIVEAMSYGLPQIVADYGGPASIVTSETGCKVKPVDFNSYPLAISKAIETLVLNPELCKKMSRASYKKIESDYLWKNKINKISLLFKSLIDNK